MVSVMVVLSPAAFPAAPEQVPEPLCPLREQLTLIGPGGVVSTVNVTDAVPVLGPLD